MKKPSAEQKDILNQEEAIVYFGLSRRKFYKLLKEGKNIPFMVRTSEMKYVIEALKGKNTMALCFGRAFPFRAISISENSLDRILSTNK